jgi:hypothetical protein
MSAVSDLTRPGELPAPQAARLRRPSWRDARLLVGLLLVLGSVLLGARVVAAADDTVPVWAANDVLAPGSSLDGNVHPVNVQLADVGGSYFDASRPLPPGLVVQRAVGRGELLPRTATAPAAAWNRRPVTIPLDGPAPAGVLRGAQVDIWMSPRDRAAGADAYGPARLMITAADVAEVTAEGGPLSAGRAATVQVMLPADRLAPVLDALANEARLALVPVPGTAPAGSS